MINPSNHFSAHPIQQEDNNVHTQEQIYYIKQWVCYMIFRKGRTRILPWKWFVVHYKNCSCFPNGLVTDKIKTNFKISANSLSKFTEVYTAPQIHNTENQQHITFVGAQLTSAAREWSKSFITSLPSISQACNWTASTRPHVSLFD